MLDKSEDLESLRTPIANGGSDAGISKKEKAKERQRRYMAKLKEARAIADGVTDRPPDEPAERGPIGAVTEETDQRTDILGQSPAEVSGAEIVESGKDTAPVVFSPASEPAPVRLEGKDAPADHPAAPERQAIDISRPPRRLPIRSKGKWQTFSAELREDFLLREAEFDNAFKRYDGLGIYAIQAEQNGTTLAKAVGQYAALEKLLSSDFLQGVEALCAMFQVPAMVLATELAKKYAPPPQQAGESAQDPMEQARAQGRLEAEIAAVRGNPEYVHFDFLRDEGTLKAVKDGNPQLTVQQVYDAAVAAHPTTRGLVMATNRNLSSAPIYRNGATQRAINSVDRSRAASKATLGSPSMAPKQNNSYDSTDTFDAVRKAVATQRGG